MFTVIQKKNLQGANKVDITTLRADAQKAVIEYARLFRSGFTIFGYWKSLIEPGGYLYRFPDLEQAIYWFERPNPGYQYVALFDMNYRWPKPFNELTS